MNLNEHFIKHTIDGQTVLVPVNGAPFHGLVQGNKTVDIILDCLVKGTDEEEITDTLWSKFKGDRKIIREDVEDVISRLKAIGAIDD